VFREQDASNYYLFGINTSTDKVLVQRVKTGSATPADVGSQVSLTMSDLVWYTLRVQVTGGPANVKIKGWVDGVLRVNYTDADSTWTSGKVGFATRASAGRFDDLRVYAGSPLP
jgi:hypothetical protein